MAGILAGIIAIPAGCWFAGRTELSLAVIGAAVLFLPLFVFLPRLIRYAMDADTDAVLDAFGKNEQVKKVFWTLFIATAGLVLAQVVDPDTAQRDRRDHRRTLPVNNRQGLDPLPCFSGSPKPRQLPFPVTLFSGMPATGAILFLFPCQ